MKTTMDFFFCHCRFCLVKRALPPFHSSHSISERRAQAVTVLHRERGGGMEQAMGRGRKTSLELLLLGAAQSRTVQRAAGRRAELPPPPAQPRGWGMDGASVERRRRGGSGVREGGSACP